MGLLNKLGSFGGTSSHGGGLGTLLDTGPLLASLTHDAHLPLAGAGTPELSLSLGETITSATHLAGSLAGPLGDGGALLDGVPGMGAAAELADAPLPIFNDHSIGQIAQSDPASVALGTGKLWLSALSGPDAAHDNSTIGLDVLSFVQAPETASPPMALTLGPHDPTNLDIDILNGAYDSEGTASIGLGPDIWAGDSPLSATLLGDPNDVFAHDLHVGGNVFAPVTDGSLTDLFGGMQLFDGLFG